MYRTSVRIRNKTGLHARPATEVVNFARKFESDITACKEGKEVNLKSLIGLLSLGVSEGDEIIVEGNGVDGYTAINEIRKFIESLKD